jgi:hypothetical protein
MKTPSAFAMRSCFTASQTPIAKAEAKEGWLIYDYRCQ